MLWGVLLEESVVGRGCLACRIGERIHHFSDLCTINRYEKQELNRIQGGPIARPIGHLALKGSAKNWVAGKLRIVKVIP